jgi:hypothetical protein
MPLGGPLTGSTPGALKDFAQEEQRRHSAFHLLPTSVQKLLFMA